MTQGVKEAMSELINRGMGYEALITENLKKYLPILLFSVLFLQLIQNMSYWNAVAYILSNKMNNGKT